MKIIEENCIGCGQCENICPEVFRVEDDGVAHVISDEVSEDAMMALEGCPTSAIEKSVD